MFATAFLEQSEHAPKASGVKCDQRHFCIAKMRRLFSENPVVPSEDRHNTDIVARNSFAAAMILPISTQHNWWHECPPCAHVLALDAVRNMHVRDRANIRRS